MSKDLFTVDPAVLNKPGQAIRALRLKLGLTLQEVSDRTGLAISTISKLEMGRASLSYEKLTVVSAGLGVELSELLGILADKAENDATPSVSGRRVVQRLGEGLALQTGAYGQTYLAVELLHKQLVPIVADVRARSIEEFVKEFGGLIKHSGEEFAYVLEGEIEFHSEFYAPVRLKAGESVYFDSSMGHAYIAASDDSCRVLSVCTDEGDQIMEQFQKHE
ncbi:transcriptional regulator, XRE family with cupin sensor [Burkholderia sp. GAS332]|uniref:helix-turn-helix domain-containing protein n=1 Tax=Paraburkholderia sp. TaxID=1926495 RepID=UPI0009272BEA|nr:transcriptional regulator, XRE family with cupin sensor [Burkholderia sp. GAS332]